MACKEEYQGRGLTGILGATCMKSLYQMNVFDGVLRLECDVRARAYYSQRFVEKTGSIPYGFIPNYNNYADKRSYNASKSNPFTEGRIEPVVMYFQPFNTFWEDRVIDIFLLNNKSILQSYNLIRQKNKRKMNSDNVITKKKSNKTQEGGDHRIKLDHYKAIVSIKGNLTEQELSEILNLYSNWNLIEWRIPTSRLGLTSQKLALDHNFRVVGYNPGSFYINNKLKDTILFAYFPKKLNSNQFENMQLTDNSKPIVKLVLNSLDETGDYDIDNSK